MLNNTKTQSRPKLLFLVLAISQTHKSLENSQDFFCQDQDQDFIFCPRGASRPRLLEDYITAVMRMKIGLARRQLDATDSSYLGSDRTGIQTYRTIADMS